MKPRHASEETLREIRHCPHSVVDAADDLTPLYLCGKGWDGGNQSKRLRLCVLYHTSYCAER